MIARHRRAGDGWRFLAVATIVVALAGIVFITLELLGVLPGTTP
jgi:hypothetical protein